MDLPVRIRFELELGSASGHSSSTNGGYIETTSVPRPPRETESTVTVAGMEKAVQLVKLPTQSETEQAP